MNSPLLLKQKSRVTAGKDTLSPEALGYLLMSTLGSTVPWAWDEHQALVSPKPCSLGGGTECVMDFPGKVTPDGSASSCWLLVPLGGVNTCGDWRPWQVAMPSLPLSTSNSTGHFLNREGGEHWAGKAFTVAVCGRAALGLSECPLPSVQGLCDSAGQRVPGVWGLALGLPA